MDRAPGSLRLRAPAKVNLYLEVLGRRPDGYHDLRTLMAPVGLFDEIEIEPLQAPGGLEVECSGDDTVAPGEANLCHRAAWFYFRRTGVEAGARIRLRKRIPVGAGLGGGSSDAAATIMGLESIFGRGLSPEDRREAARAVGADIPFFFARGPAWVEGIGELVRPVCTFPVLWLVLVHPGVSLSTAAVYSRLGKGLTSRPQANSITRFDLPEIARGLRNDLETAARELAPAIGEVLRALGEVGSEACLMSGSGSAAFGLFADEGRARQAAAAVSERSPDWRVEAVCTLRPGAFPFLLANSDWGVDKR